MTKLLTTEHVGAMVRALRQHPEWFLVKQDKEAGTIEGIHAPSSTTIFRALHKTDGEGHFVDAWIVRHHQNLFSPGVTP